MKREKDFNRAPLAVFASYYRPHWKLFLLDVVMALVSTGADLAFPYASRWALNTLLPGNLYRVFFTVMGLLLALYLLRSGALYVVAVKGHGLGVSSRRICRRTSSPRCRPCPSPFLTGTARASS